MGFMIWAKPRDRPDLHGFGWDSWGKVVDHDEHDEHGGESGDTNSHTHTNRYVLVGPNHQLDRSREKRPFGRSPAKRPTD